MPNPLETDPDNRVEYSVVVPVFRGRDTLDDLCAQLAAVLAPLSRGYEILLVDDASNDGSWDVICKLASETPTIVGIQLMRNFGQHNATNCGLSSADGEFVITIDEDLQFLPKDIEILIACQRQENADVVYGVPRERQQSWWRQAGSRIARLIVRSAMGVHFDISSFRLMRRSVAKVVASAVRHDILIDVYLSWASSRMTAIPVSHCQGRPSGYSPIRLALHMVNIVCNYTIAPLRAATAIGALLSLVSLVLAAYFIYVRIAFGTVVPGFTAVIVTVLMSTGLIVFFMGVTAEYVGRIFQYINRKPQWIVRETTSHHIQKSDAR